MRVLLIGDNDANVGPATNAWATRLTSEGVPFTLVGPGDVAALSAASLLDPADTTGSTGMYDGVVLADGSGYSATDLAAVYAYEVTFGVRQVDANVYPSTAVGLTASPAGLALDGDTATLTATATGSSFSYLKGSVPFQVGSFGDPDSVVAGAPFTPYLTDTHGVLAGVYQHPTTDVTQAGVSEMVIDFSYNANQQQWLMLAPGMIDWVTQGAHLGLYRNYLGQDIDDVFIPDNEWDTALHCVPAASNPPDYTCPVADQDNPAAGPADVMMSAADVDYVVAWEKANGLTLNLAFNGVGACTNNGVTGDAATTVNCTATDTANATTLPGSATDTSFPNNGAFVDELLKDKADFNWITHTWSHQFLGCINWLAMPVNAPTAGTTGTLAAGTYNYEVTAATAYGESEPSLPQPVTLAANGSTTLTWSDAPNGGGPTLAALQQEFPLPANGFWGYKVYREAPGGTTYGLVGQVAEDPSGTASYTFTDTGATTPGSAPTSGDTFPTATDPGILCADGGWLPATSTTADSSIEQEINLDIAFAQANGLPNDNEQAVVTGEHSGVENPNMPAAIAATGITTFAADGSRQPQHYTIGAASDSPRYPNNIYYDASNWTDEVDQYDTIYKGTAEGSYNEAEILASESSIAMGHLLANDPHVTYAHQSDLIGGTDPANGYTILTLLSDILGQYNALYNQPVTQMNDTTAAQTLADNANWDAAEAANAVSAYASNGVEYITNNSTASVNVPVTAGAAAVTTVAGLSGPFGDLYGGTRSAWVTIAAGQTEEIDPAAAVVAPPVTPPTTGGGGGSFPVVGSSSTGATVTRIAGSDRYATAIAVSQTEFPTGGAGAVVLARGDDYPDALVGTSLATAKNGPLLLTTGATLPSATATELARVLGAGKTVYILGGTSAVPASIATQLTALGYTVVRYGGATRFATAVQVADALGDPTTVLLATGTNFPDALSAGVAAAKAGGVVLLTNGTSLPAETSAYLAAHPGTTYAIGGPAATADPSATAIVGSDRYGTAEAVAAKFFTSPTTLGVATGLSFPDALAGGALLAHDGAPLLLSSPSSLPTGVSSYLTSVKAGTTGAYVFGGTTAVSADVATAVGAALVK